jgi:hypothetical protein
MKYLKSELLVLNIFGFCYSFIFCVVVRFQMLVLRFSHCIILTTQLFSYSALKSLILSTYLSRTTFTILVSAWILFGLGFIRKRTVQVRRFSSVWGFMVSVTTSSWRNSLAEIRVLEPQWFSIFYGALCFYFGCCSSRVRPLWRTMDGDSSSNLAKCSFRISDARVHSGVFHQFRCVWGWHRLRLKRFPTIISYADLRRYALISAKTCSMISTTRAWMIFDKFSKRFLWLASS